MKPPITTDALWPFDESVTAILLMAVCLWLGYLIGKL
jgi:hypothetical protein